MHHRLLHISAILISFGVASLTFTSGLASARGKGMRECKASGPPSVLEGAGSQQSVQMLLARGQPWLLTTDDPAKPRKLQLLSSDGQALELGPPQVTTEVSRFIARGQGIYAAATVRSALTPGKRDVVLLRWGSDTRPRMTVLSTTDQVDAKPTTALVNEYATVLWAQPGSDGKSHLLAAATDLEELKVSETQDLGAFEPGGFIEAFSHDKSLTVVWSAPGATMQAVLDKHGKPSAPARALQRKDASAAIRGMQLCGEKLWLISRLSDKELAVSVTDAAGLVTQLATLPMTPNDLRIPLSCVDAGVVIAHPVFTEKTSNIVVWISAIDSDGKKRERRLKDERGQADTVRSLELQGSKDPSGAWWTEGRGAALRFVFRPLSCE